ncbi:ABC transporter substrate-binding protein [Candidatus Gottesmanbacteria bacterium]|nr:ABC transporter substrate-binding protein [Candidatus Gottesmanbacteria bacterium]
MRNFFRQFRLFFWFAKAFISKHCRLLFSGFVAGFLIFLLLLKLYPILISPFTSWRTKKIAIVGTYTPTTLPSHIQNLISIGLTSLDQTGGATLSLAIKWEAKEDGKVYIFNLKSGLLWHDGTKFKASDVNYNLKDVKFESISDDILKITLKEPFSPLPSILARPIFKRGLVGLGPYKVEKLKLKGDKLASISLVPKMSGLPPLEFKFYPTETAATTAFKLGEVNVLDKISQTNDFSSWPGVSITSQTYFNFNVILFYNTRLAILQKRGVRQALAYALPSFPEEKSFGPLNPISWAYNSAVKTYSQNQELAKSLLAKEGLATISATLTISTFPSFLNYAQDIASAWENLGLKTQVKVENSLPTDFDALLLSQEIPADPDQYHLWHSTQSTNITGFAHPKIDKLLEDGRKIIDKEKRLKIYQDFQRYLVEEAPAIFLYHPKLYTVERK